MPVVKLQPADVLLGTARRLKEKLFVAGLPLRQQVSKPAPAGVFCKAGETLVACEDLSRLPHSCSPYSRKGKARLLFVSLSALGTEG